MPKNISKLIVCIRAGNKRCKEVRDMIAQVESYIHSLSDFDERDFVEDRLTKAVTQ